MQISTPRPMSPLSWRLDDWRHSRQQLPESQGLQLPAEARCAEEKSSRRSTTSAGVVLGHLRQCDDPWVQALTGLSALQPNERPKYSLRSSSSALDAIQGTARLAAEGLFSKMPQALLRRPVLLVWVEGIPHGWTLALQIRWNSREQDGQPVLEGCSVNLRPGSLPVFDALGMQPHKMKVTQIPIHAPKTSGRHGLASKPP